MPEVEPVPPLPPVADSAPPAPPPAPLPELMFIAFCDGAEQLATFAPAGVGIERRPDTSMTPSTPITSWRTAMTTSGRAPWIRALNGTVTVVPASTQTSTPLLCIAVIAQFVVSTFAGRSSGLSGMASRQIRTSPARSWPYWPKHPSSGIASTLASSRRTSSRSNTRWQAVSSSIASAEVFMEVVMEARFLRKRPVTSSATGRPYCRFFVGVAGIEPATYSV
ncbi:MAG: hypothetical protein M3619_20435 [Myxococcota bacterium]|nr:hypothetical protein [Myxococcota bacterium]